MDLTASQIDRTVATITRIRLSKYLSDSNDDDRAALELYILNAKAGAAVMVDLHYVEVALRNRFSEQLRNQFGESWYQDEKFLGLVDEKARNLLSAGEKRIRSQSRSKNRTGTPLPSSDKLVAELSFGFWSQLTDSRYEHCLWVPYLHKIFAAGSRPKRAVFNQQLEALRQLRNRIAHHEPIFHLGDLIGRCELIQKVGEQLMRSTSTASVEVQRLLSYRRSTKPHVDRRSLQT